MDVDRGRSYLTGRLLRSQSKERGEQMPESFPSVMTFPNRASGDSKTSDVLHLTGATGLLHTPHDIVANTMNHSPGATRSVWADSSESKDFRMQDPPQSGLLQQTMSDLVSEIAQVIEHCPSGCGQPLGGVSYYVASVIVQQFTAEDDAATIAQALLNKFPGTLHNRSAINLVEQATKMIRTVRPGWKRQALMPDEENSPPLDNQTPSSADSNTEPESPVGSETPVTPEIPVESRTQNSDIEAPSGSSAESTTPRIPVGELFSDSHGASPNETAADRSAADIKPTDNDPVDVDLAASKPMAADTQRSPEPTPVTKAPTKKKPSPMRLFQYPNLRRFVPAA